MKSQISLWGIGLIALGGAANAQGAPQAAFQEPAGAGPRGSSQPAPGEVRYDEVGYAGLADMGGISVASSALSPGSYVEVTALDSGRTILAVVTGNGSAERLVLLSPGAAGALGIASEPAPVRVRRVVPGPQDAALLAAGQAASGRGDAPSALLVPLRKRLAPLPVAAKPAAVAKPDRQPPPVRTSPQPALTKPIPRPAAPPPQPRAQPQPPTPAVARPAAGGYYVQVAALSSRVRAQALAKSLGGNVEAAGAVYRVRLGPYPDAAAAAQGRATAARKGYPDARVVRSN
ncbi:SPOR domain-containing protein [Sphingomonas sp.]|uniref:SPOR domain-containing protein n=1 Tax=Sphingomonas sp. TaxID=28214 RepID=UPI002BE63AAA|nr:SPOR domain-containing protein [Sphingomonas sp.]HWK34638.1 SPOR domain-containing protein [Sphingomonas sp.]